MNFTPIEHFPHHFLEYSQPPAWKTTSEVIGWMYFVSWTLMFFPQTTTNYLLKDVSGFSIDYAIMNPQGYFFYSMYSISGFIDSKLGTGEVLGDDLAFTLMAFSMSSMQMTQIFIYPRGTQKFRPAVLGLIAGCYFAVLLAYVLEITGVNTIRSLNSLQVAGYCKAVITCVKYIPQVILNYERKSCKGLSYANVWLDFTGGLLSFIQQAIDCITGEGPVFGEGGSFNLVKVLLGFVSMTFNIIFMVQNYCIYTSPPAQEEAKQLGASSESQKKALLESSFQSNKQMQASNDVNASQAVETQDQSYDQSVVEQIKTDESDDEPLAPKQF